MWWYCTKIGSRKAALPDFVNPLICLNKTGHCDSAIELPTSDDGVMPAALSVVYKRKGIHC